MTDANGKRPAAFIDRDGTLIEEVNFLSDVGDLQVFPYTADALKLLRDSGYWIVVVTNQSGIGRGIYSEADMHAIHDAMQAELGGAIDAFYFCPHLPDEGCECRKPGLGMLNFAQRDLEIDLERSWMIGDKRIDVETGRAAKIGAALVLTGYGKEHQHELEQAPDVIGDDLLKAVELIVQS
ncbi:MAG TPA: HAD family hydrolase [Pyrinomonadaceae bacterium]|nr:HAD family hydrolase [Pyrinomonadaceae bacterium]